MSELNPSVTDKPLTDVDPSYQPFHDAEPPLSAQATAIAESDSPVSPTGDAEDEELQPPTDFTVHFPAYLPTPPFIHIQGIPNFRDLGGYSCPPPPSARNSTSLRPHATNKQYMVRRHLLYRCAHPTQLTPMGASTMRQLGITDIFDLRSQPEIDKLVASAPQPHPVNDTATTTPTSAAGETKIDSSNGYIVIPGITRTFTPVYLNEDYSPVALARKLQWYTAANAPNTPYSEGFVSAYRDIATHAARDGAYATILRQLITSLQKRSQRPVSSAADLDGILGHHKRHGSDVVAKDGGVVFHCTAGKDRTGVLAAVILKLLGVDVETICWEYAITEPGLGSWRDLFIERISRTGLSWDRGGKGNATTRAEAARICGSRAANMREWLGRVLEGEFGGVDKYLMEMVGLSEMEVEVLTERLVVEVPHPDEVVKPVAIEGWTLEGGMDEDRKLENGEVR